MSLFDRYDQNEAEIFLRHTCFISTPEQRFEDLFEQIHQHFPQTDLFSTNERENSIKYLEQGDNLFMDRLILHNDHHNDLFLESISHLLVFNLVTTCFFSSSIFILIFINRVKILRYEVVPWMH